MLPKAVVCDDKKMRFIRKHEASEILSTLRIKTRVKLRVKFSCSERLF